MDRSGQHFSPSGSVHLARVQRSAMAAFTGVVTTGIYCRDGCPATPLRRNTRPYAHPAAAEAAGFRACLRCRPDQQPPDGWIDAPELVCRALRLIADGALDDDTEDGLASRVGVSARHLRRLFDAHVGATPSEVARSRRAHFARRLLDDTDLPVAVVGAAAGFRSVRDLNRVIKETFRFTPTELRAKRRDPRRLVADGGLALRLPYRPPLAWNALLRFLAPRAIPGVESVDLDAAVYRRTIHLDGNPGVLEARDDAAAAALVLTVHLPRFDGLVHLVPKVRRLFDLDTDPAAVDTHLARDPELRGRVRARRGLRVPGAVDPLELTVRAVLGQQVGVATATGFAGRLVQEYGTPLPGVTALGLTHLFPDAPTLATIDHRRIGTTEVRGRTIRAAAATVPSLVAPDLDDLVARLGAIPGIGPWTAQYVAMRAFAERDAFPAGDLGLRGAMGGISAPELTERARRWRPWRAYAAVHLWSG
ncbi:MAG: AlkA N-terminal domain-containing protein [Actinomycetota bacterium]